MSIQFDPGNNVTAREAHFQCTVDGKRLESGVFGLMSLSAVAVILLTEPPLAFTVLGAGIFSVLSLVFLLAAIGPRALFLQGVVLTPDGFEFRAQLRMPKRIAYSGIHRIEAVCRGDGDSGDDVHMLIRSSSGNALVTWHMRGGLTLFDKLAALPGFDHDKWSRAGAYAPAGKDLIFGKKFVVYERSI